MKIVASLTAVLFLAFSTSASAQAVKIDFRRDIAPLLEKHCYECHGPDKKRGGLRLTTRVEALTPADSGIPVLVPGDAAKSDLFHRLTSADKDEKMPPKGKGLSGTEVALMKRWIEQGLDWPSELASKKHWAYQKPTRLEEPKTSRPEWVRNPIDAFILAKLDKEKLTPSAPAEPAKLLRRVYLDLTGVPPTVREVEEFERAYSANGQAALEVVVDRLLASPRYGERWARPWLDLARYADSNGFQRDGFRDIWAYRDYVIHAFNSGLPFDVFVREQVAGDLLPGSTVTQKIATGFNRCVPINLEAGVDREEVRILSVVDRVNTLGTVFLGTTLACAQCHNHKYDPITQEDYYRLFAYFNNTPIETVETKGAARELTGPKMAIPDPPGMEGKWAELRADLVRMNKEMAALSEKIAATFAEKEKQILADPLALKTLSAKVMAILKTDATKRTDAQKQELVKAFVNQDQRMTQMREELSALEQQLAESATTTTLVMEEMAKPRDTFVMKRGNFLDKGTQVKPGTPPALHAQGIKASADRVGLADWLVSYDNPLLARVTVNRWWADIFGRGIVSTLEDFGTQAEAPTHPELLDWLATEFIGNGWSMKGIHKLIVTSAAYQQSSRVTAEQLRRDPENKWLARGPRQRLEAEMIRDQALAVAGLLSSKVGGPPVFPPQPAGLWNVTGRVDNTYRVSTGEDRYRRGIYTIWRRSSPYPSFVAFDAPDRAACMVSRPRTNTPLQALTLLNDPVYVETALAFATRVLQERPKADTSEQIEYAFRRCLARKPTNEEASLLREALEREKELCKASPKDVERLLTGFTVPEGIDRVSLASWYAVTAILLNLDETITK